MLQPYILFVTFSGSLICARVGRPGALRARNNFRQEGAVLVLGGRQKSGAPHTVTRVFPPYKRGFLAFFCMATKVGRTPRIGNKPRDFVAPRHTYPCTRVRYRYDTHNTADDEKRGFSHGDRGGYQERNLDARMSLRDRCKYYTLVAR